MKEYAVRIYGRGYRIGFKYREVDNEIRIDHCGFEEVVNKLLYLLYVDIRGYLEGIKLDVYRWEVVLPKHRFEDILSHIRAKGYTVEVEEILL